MVRRYVYALVLLMAVAALTAPLLAGARATLILTSGERVKGILVDMGGSDFTMNEGASEIKIPIGEVAVIDFAGGGQTPAGEVSKMQSGRSLVVQRGGDVFYGRLIDIRGDNPPRLVFNTADGELEVNSSEVARIYIRRWEGMPAAETKPEKKAEPAAETAGGGGTVVHANGSWVNTGVQIRRGQMVAFSASGQIVLSDDAGDTAGPAGAHNGRLAGEGAAMPRVAAGALVGRVGSSMPFAIGNQTQALQMPGAGILFLVVNDETPGDNRGQFRVQITVVR